MRSLSFFMLSKLTFVIWFNAAGLKKLNAGASRPLKLPGATRYGARVAANLPTILQQALDARSIVTVWCLSECGDSVGEITDNAKLSKSPRRQQPVCSVCAPYINASRCQRCVTPASTGPLCQHRSAQSASALPGTSGRARTLPEVILSATRRSALASIAAPASVRG